ncbi:MAG TPA: response regulator transcription factor [Chitinophagaceae bacterium]|nr:response regulator transcription factor [Chitinophagaceae bacterium]
MPTSIAFVDDKAINRSTFLQKVNSFDDLSVTFTAVNGHDCIEQLKGLPLSKQPEIIFVDLEMPELNGIQTIQIAKPLYPHIHFIVLTVFDDDEKIFEAIQAGASGYLLKDDSAIEIHNAITNCKEYGGAPMSPAIARKAFDLLSKVTYPASTQSNEKNNPLTSLLSDREKEILKYTIHGFDAKRTAETLGISTLTVRKHISNVYEKLQVNSKAQVMTLAHQYKWFE